MFFDRGSKFLGIPVILKKIPLVLSCEKAYLMRISSYYCHVLCHVKSIRPVFIIAGNIKYNERHRPSIVIDVILKSGALNHVSVS